MWKTSGTTQKYSTSNNINLDDIDALKNDPCSAKAQACKEKILKTIIHDSSTWKQLQKEMQGSNLHTNMGMSFILNGEVLEKIGLQLVEKQNENIQRDNMNCDDMSSTLGENFYKRGSGSIKTTMKPLEQCDEFMSNIKGILKFCRSTAKVSSSFSEITTDNTVTPARKNSFNTPRSMSLNTYQQMTCASSLNTTKNLIPGRRSSSSLVERRLRYVATKTHKRALEPSDQDHLRALLQHAVAETPGNKQSKSKSEEQLIVDNSSREMQGYKMPVPGVAANDRFCTNPEVIECPSDEIMLGAKKMDVTLSSTPQAGAVVAERRRNSSQTDRRLRYGSSVILQNFSKMNEQEEETKPRRKSSIEGKLARKIPNPKRCQATAA